MRRQYKEKKKDVNKGENFKTPEGTWDWTKLKEVIIEKGVEALVNNEKGIVPVNTLIKLVKPEEEKEEKPVHYEIWMGWGETYLKWYNGELCQKFNWEKDNLEQCLKSVDFMINYFEEVEEEEDEDYSEYIEVLRLVKKEGIHHPLP